MDKKKEVEDFFASLPEDQRQSLIQGAKDIYDKYIAREQAILNEFDTRISEIDEKREANRIEQKTAVYPRSSELFGEMKELLSEKSVLQRKRLNQQNRVFALQNGGEMVSFEDKKGFKHDRIPDFREINTDNFTFDIDLILSEPKPKYIPEMNEEALRARGFIFDAIRIAPDSYIVAIKQHDEESQENDYVILTLDQLVLTSDYYFTKRKAELKKQADEKNKANENYWNRLSDDRKQRFLMQSNIYHSLPKKIQKTITKEEYEKKDWKEREKIYKFYKRSKPKRITSNIEEDKMPTSFSLMYQRFVNPEARTLDMTDESSIQFYLENNLITEEKIAQMRGSRSQSRGRYAHAETWSYWAKFREMMEFKIKDIRIQREDLAESYAKAIETSFGDSNINDSLKEKYGINVKRQDGSEIGPTYIDQIEKAWKSVTNKFGDLKPNADKYSLKISHTGKKYVFAMKAVGVYVPQMGTIGVSDKFGDSQFRSTMSHEVGHWIDHLVGEVSGKRWASDDYESTAGILAFTFRNNMNKPKSQQSDYINCTKECFARAMQMYYSIETDGKSAGVPFSYAPLKETKAFFYIDHFVPEAAYYSEIKPLVEKFLAENKDILNYTVDVDGSSEPSAPEDTTPIPPEVAEPQIQQSQPDNVEEAIKALTVLLELESDVTTRDQIQEAIEALELLK